MAARDFADQTGLAVQYELPIIIDRWIGRGSIPTVWLQHRFHDPSHVSWLDRLTFAVYGCHFFALWLTGYALWERHVRRFVWFSIASVVCYACALPMHFLAPTAPPWMAAQQGLIEPVTRIFWSVGREVSPRTIDAIAGGVLALVSWRLGARLMEFRTKAMRSD